MKKIMLVDDEILIRENIRECVDWEKEGFLYCGDAPDGELALPIIEEQLPDILITDIKMPFMNGLELTSVVRQKFPQIKIIILSGHDDFQYAQKALRLGVEDYCLKPFSSADLLQLLRSVSTRIDEELRIRHKYAYTPENLFADLCGGLIHTAAAIEAAAQLDLLLTAPYYATAIFTLNPQEHEEPESTEPPHPPQNSEELLAGLLKEVADSFIYKRSRTETILIYKGSDPAQMNSILDELCASAKQRLRAACGLELSVSRGKVCERLQGIHLSYLEAENDRMFKRMARVHSAAMLDAYFDPSAQGILLDRSRMIQFLKLGDHTQMPEFLLELSAALEGMNWDSGYACYLMNDITLELVQTAKNGFRAAANHAEILKELQTRLKPISSTDEGLQYLKRLYERLWEWRSEGADKHRELIDKVKQYIREQYDKEQLSLNDISKVVRVSPSHLSKTFSQATGQTITEFLTATRMDRAKELLKSTGHKTFEIAYLVGYNDQHYFSNLFKKVTGMTPMEFRKQGNSEDQLQAIRRGAEKM
ncbi:response regulator [Paenibacillus tritici]|uniref:Response regulator n=1 Tax=Paenibacillus tritici TaxID=1873425 RepID=A0ABX2DX28_9BACL|nr:response regulator [Paenibacillus tritici]NQX49245.1 response regulator [Paenibacillus tritici]